MELVKFLKQQFHLLLCNVSTFPVSLLVFSSIVFTISPHACRFIRSTSKVKSSHPDTIQYICASNDMNPSLEQQDVSFLSYAKRLPSTIKEHERNVTIMIDEIHFQAYLEYKGRFLTGAATNSQNSGKTAYVLII